MILTSANTLENKEIIEYKGLVTGESLIGANIYKDFFEQIDLTFKYYRCNIYE